MKCVIFLLLQIFMLSISIYLPLWYCMRNIFVITLIPVLLILFHKSLCCCIAISHFEISQNIVNFGQFDEKCKMLLTAVTNTLITFSKISYFRMKMKNSSLEKVVQWIKVHQKEKISIISKSWKCFQMKILFSILSACTCE